VQISVVSLKTAVGVTVTSCAGITTRQLDDVTSSSTAAAKETTTDSTRNLSVGQRAKLIGHKACGRNLRN